MHYTQYLVHCTLYTVHCTLYTVHCTLYTLHCTLYTVNGYSCARWSADHNAQNMQFWRANSIIRRVQFDSQTASTFWLAELRRVFRRVKKSFIRRPAWFLLATLFDQCLSPWTRFWHEPFTRSCTMILSIPRNHTFFKCIPGRVLV